MRVWVKVVGPVSKVYVLSLETQETDKERKEGVGRKGKGGEDKGNIKRLKGKVKGGKE